MVKDKSSNSRTFDVDGFRKVSYTEILYFRVKFLETKTTTYFFLNHLFLQRAACICVKSEDESEVSELMNVFSR